MKKLSFVAVAGLAVVSNVFAGSYYVEPMVGSHHKVDEDSQKQKSELMGGLRLGTELSNRLDLELGMMTGKAKGKNDYKSQRENLGTLGLAYNLVDNKTGFVPYVTGAVGTLDGITSTVVGVGVKYGFENQSALRFDVRDFIQNGDHDLVTTIGYVIPFGQKVANKSGASAAVNPTQLQQQQSEEAVRVKTPKIELPSSVEKVKQFEQKSFDTIVFFDFDKDSIKSCEAKKLTNFAKNTKKVNELNVTLTGFTDVLGSEAYNRKLSQKRADNVKKFLEKEGLNVSIQANGKGIKGKEKGKAKRALNRVVIIKANGKVQK